MALDEYKRKRRFEQTPEPPAKLEKRSGHRFVVQKHSATRLHYDFRLEMEGVLKSWAVPKGPSLDPTDKRLAMQVEDHPVSYFDFEGTIPQGNYGAGTVMVWDVGTWQPLSPQPVKGKFVPGTEAEARAMLEKGDFKIRLHGKRLNGDFAMIHMRSRRPGTKGTEWLLIKKQDDAVVKGYDIEAYNTSVLTGRTMAGIAGDHGSAEWTSSRQASGGKLKAEWLAKTIAKLDQRTKSARAAQGTEKTLDPKAAKMKGARTKSSSSAGSRDHDKTSSVAAAVKDLPGASRKPLPAAIQPMLATLAEKPFDDPAWLFEIKWDGYRAVAFLENGKFRLVSRTQNDLTARFPELEDIPKFLQAKTAILDGEIVALDPQGRSSFSLMQERTGIRSHGRHGPAQPGVPLFYYAFDLLYLDGQDLHRVRLEQRKETLARVITAGGAVRYSDHFAQGVSLFEAAKQKGLEGILAKRRDSYYEEKRSREWLKIKITHEIECVIGGYTDPEGSRKHFGALVLGLYDEKRHLIHTGQAGTGFNHRTLADLWQLLKRRETRRSPFHGEVEVRQVHWVKPELVAQIKFSEWTHETAAGGLKLRAPVYLGLRDDKRPEDCTFETQS